MFVSTKLQMMRSMSWVALLKAARHQSSLLAMPKTTWPKVTDDPSNQSNEEEDTAKNTWIVGEVMKWDLACRQGCANAHRYTPDQTVWHMLAPSISRLMTRTFFVSGKAVQKTLFSRTSLFQSV
jgi:hypothetical protein